MSWNPMARERVARFLTVLVAVGFLGTAAIHSTGYDSVARQAKQVPGSIGEIMPALWLAFSFDLSVLGLIAGVLAARPRDVARPILAFAGLCPFSAAALQVAFIGVVPPTFLLIGLGILTWVAAAVWPRHVDGDERRRT